ncbi:hypothetical protein F5X98DRAFT_385719 [Xylaria grammica]|nr:hypothetical protein F5X98DRAFT_385719 [Xylaria grammica]
MDSSSFASAAASLLCRTIQIIGFLYGDWEYSSLALAERLIYELSQLRNVLQSLEETALSVADMVSPPPDDLLACLEDMKTLLISLLSKVSRQDARDSNLLWPSFNALTSPRGSSLQLSPTETASDIQQLQKYLSKLTSSIAKSVFCPIEKPLPKRIADPTETLWKYRAEYAESHESARKSRLDGTGRWFVVNSKFQNWLTTEYAPNTLFCTGRPGSGKTVLASLSIDSVQKWQKDMISPSVGLAYFYFNYEIPSPPRNVALALLEQLHLQSPSPLPDQDITKLEALAAKAVLIPFSDIVSAIIAVSKQFQRVYIIIDALDECSPEHQDELLYLLTSIKNSPVRLLAFSTSHRTFNIFNDSPNIKIIPSKQDILLYAQSGLQSLPVDREYLRAAIIANLLDIGNQHLMFQPIVLQLHDVLSKMTPEDITRELGNVPRGIDAAYRDIFNQIFTQDPKMVKIARRTFTWIYFSLRTLETAEIIEVHRRNTTEVEVDTPLIVTSCMGLLGQSGSKMYFAHTSVPEFIKGMNIGDEKEVAFHCLSYISSLNVDEVTGSESVSSLIQSNPLLDYAANYWGRHIRNVIYKSNDELATLKQSCLQLLKDKPRVTILCHILFMSRPHPKIRAMSGGLVKSSSLHLAAYFGLDWAIDSPSVSMDSATECDEWGRTPLHIAAENGFDDCVMSLLTKTSPNQQDIYGRTAWHYAAMSGNNQSISHLLEWRSGALSSNRLIPATSLGADGMGKGKSPLEYAAVNGNAEMVRTLFPLYTSEFDNNIKTEPFLANAMLSAAERGKIDIVEYILSQDQTPHYEHLLAATKGGFEDIVQLLLEYGVDVTNPVENGDSAIVIAACDARNTILKLLIWNTVLVGTNKEIDDALFSAVKEGNTEGVLILLRAGANPNASVVDGRNELIVHAVRHHMADIVEILCSNGVEPSQAVSVAVATGNSKILEILLNRKIPNLETTGTQSLIEKARAGGHTAIVQLLLDDDGSSPSEKPVPPDNVVDIQTHTEKRTPSDADAASLDKSSEMPIPKQSETSPPPKTPQEIINIETTEPTKQPESRSDTDNKVPNTTTTRPVTFTSPLPVHNELPTSGPYWKSSMSLSPTEQGVARVPAPASDSAPFLFLSEPIEVDSIGLGSVVIAPRDPLSGYAPKDLSSLSPVISNFKSISSLHSLTSMSDRRSTSGLALGVFQPLLTRKSNPSRLVNIKAPRVSRERLHNHEQALERIFSDIQLRDEIGAMMRATDRKEERKELFFVVGLLIATNLRTTISGSAMLSESSEVSHEGEKIFAISYRSIKVRTRRAMFNLRGGASLKSNFYLSDYFSPKAYERFL